MRSSIILTVPFAAMALGQVVRSLLWIRTPIDLSINLSSFDESQTPSPKKTGLAKCCPFLVQLPRRHHQPAGSRHHSASASDHSGNIAASTRHYPTSTCHRRSLHSSWRQHNLESGSVFVYLL